MNTTNAVADVTKPAAHKAGPWKLIEGEANLRDMSKIVVVADESYRIALVQTEWSNPRVRAEDLANGHLLAAAPELLAAAMNAQELLVQLIKTPMSGAQRELCRDILAPLNVAIAKAGGAS